MLEIDWKDPGEGHTLRSLFDTPDLTVVKGGILWQKPMKQHRQAPAVG